MGFEVDQDEVSRGEIVAVVGGDGIDEVAAVGREARIGAFFADVDDGVLFDVEDVDARRQAVEDDEFFVGRQHGRIVSVGRCIGNRLQRLGIFAHEDDDIVGVVGEVFRFGEAFFRAQCRFFIAQFEFEHLAIGEKGTDPSSSQVT